MVKVSRKGPFRLSRWIVGLVCILILVVGPFLLGPFTLTEETWNYQILTASEKPVSELAPKEDQHYLNDAGIVGRREQQLGQLQVGVANPPNSAEASPASVEVAPNSDQPRTKASIVTTSGRRLRLDWTNLQLYSSLAQDMLAHQTNCSLPVINFRYRNRFGLGSDLHVWSQGFCNAFESQVRVRSQHPWIFWDEEACKEYEELNSSMICYFPAAELQCPGDTEDNTTENVSYSNGLGCKGMLAKYGGQLGIPDIRSAAMEFLFRSVSPVLVKEAERQLHLVFPNGVVPSNLITVHMRWGDKKQEMKLRKPWEYVRAVRQILEKRTALKQGHNHTSVSILLATEDPEALRQFKDAAPTDWVIYIDQFYTEMLPFRIDEYNGGPKMTRQLRGKTGLIALGSLLVSMESNYFVLTTASNWSRLMDELRKNVLDPRCNNCTLMVDLKSGQW